MLCFGPVNQGAAAFTLRYFAVLTFDTGRLLHFL